MSVNSPRTTVLPLLLRATTMPVAAAGGACPAAPSRPSSRTSSARELARPQDAAAIATDAVAPPWELVDATADGIPILRVGVKVGITVVGIDAEDREAGAAVRAAEAQQRRPRHP
jgi:hypothetical protein